MGFNRVGFDPIRKYIANGKVTVFSTYSSDFQVSAMTAVCNFIRSISQRFFQHLLRFKKQSSCSDFLTVVCRKPGKDFGGQRSLRLFLSSSFNCDYDYTIYTINYIYMKIEKYWDIHIHLCDSSLPRFKFALILVVPSVEV